MGVQLKQQADGSLGLEGADLDAGAFVVLSMPYLATSSPLTQSVAVMKRRMVVKDISLVPDVASSNAVTIAAWQAPSGTALASGTALHTGSGNLQGTANTNQALTLSAVAGALQVNAGARIGFVISGALGASGSGVITFTLAPA